MLEVDELISDGALVHVLSPDEVLAARQRVLDKLEEYQERAKGPELAVPAHLMHQMVGTTLASSTEEAFSINPMPEGADAAAEAALEAMEDADIEAWSEDDESTDAVNEEGETNGEEEQYEEFEVEVEGHQER